MVCRPRISNRIRAVAAAALLALSACLSGCVPGFGDSSAAGSSSLSLPTIPWEGGPAYWAHFDRAKASGWSDPSFFPIGVWWDTVSSLEQAKFDKSLGINTYIQNGTTLDSSFLDETGMFWIGDKLNDSFTTSTKNWVGYFLDDEVDGRYSPEAGRAHLTELRKSVPQGMFAYTNFTSMVAEQNMKESDATAFVNDFTDVVSVDKYWYTNRQCHAEPYYDASLIPVDQHACRSASSYGKTIQALRQRNSAGTKLQSIWQFVEDLGGAGGTEDFTSYIAPQELKGAVMNSLIHEARGVVYFNSSLGGPCQAGNVIRNVEYNADSCAKDQVAAVGQVNAQIHRLAPVLNTQSYTWDCGPGLETMVKSSGGFAYIFAMTAAGTSPGTRTFQLPKGVRGTTAEVVDESRQLGVDASGHFSDSFASESSYHIYKIKI
ncbi:MAG: hypothetical protein HOQ07_12375 [Sinomonas sp.]|nr:hypothetical protein [Sinomonas sp.]